MAFRPAHGEEVITFQLEDLSPHQVQDMRANTVYLPAVPTFHRISFQCVVVLMIPADKGQRERKTFQPVQRSIVTAISKPHTAKVSGADHNVPLCHLCLLGKYSGLKRSKFPWQSPVTKSFFHLPSVHDFLWDLNATLQGDCDLVFGEDFYCLHQLADGAFVPFRNMGRCVFKVRAASMMR